LTKDFKHFNEIIEFKDPFYQFLLIELMLHSKNSFHWFSFHFLCFQSFFWLDLSVLDLMSCLLSQLFLIMDDLFLRWFAELMLTLVTLVWNYPLECCTFQLYLVMLLYWNGLLPNHQAISWLLWSFLKDYFLKNHHSNTCLKHISNPLMQVREVLCFHLLMWSLQEWFVHPIKFLVFQSLDQSPKEDLQVHFFCFLGPITSF